MGTKSLASRGTAAYARFHPRQAGRARVRTMETKFTPTSMSVAAPLDAYLSQQDEIDGAIQRVLLSGSYIQGSEGAAFEEEFGRYLDMPYVLGTASGTDALQLALRACGIGPGDYVVTVSH